MKDQAQREGGGPGAAPARGTLRGRAWLRYVVAALLRTGRMQGGFTLVELIVVTGVSSMILVVLAATTTRLLWDSPRLQDATLALDEVLRAQRATRVDLQRAQSTDLPLDGTPASSMTLTYVPVGADTPVTVTYQITDTTLERVVTGGTTRAVVRNVASVQFSRSAAGTVYRVTLTATTSFPGKTGDTQTWEVFQRITG